MGTDSMKKEKLIIDGNAFYEIDLECLNRKKQREKAKENRRKQQGKRRGA